MPRSMGPEAIATTSHIARGVSGKAAKRKGYKINVRLRLPRSLHTFLRVEARTGYYASPE